MINDRDLLQIKRQPNLQKKTSKKISEREKTDLKLKKPP
jgi:hypothetical protein